MPRRSRYSGGKNAPQGRGRRPGSGGKPPADRPSVPVASQQANIQSIDTPAPASFPPVKKDAPPPPYILRELKRTAIIAGALLILLVILSLVL